MDRPIGRFRQQHRRQAPVDLGRDWIIGAFGRSQLLRCPPPVIRNIISHW
ncbi:MAG: hypothetical protein ACJ8FS_06930 [Sphingomicrobium sp.]